ncbi:LPS export ABC transporter ATP-binding protein [bacterium]|jgi:lipopolysaccharide export system ATP-binding protein|nr:LPS export ABC transporter ATP-binding protein [bacterium]
MIEAKKLKKSYGGRCVVKDVSLTVKRGEVVGLLGPNGAGKTTTFYMIVGLVRPDEGDVLLDNQSVTTTAMFKRARLGLGYLPQEPSIFKKLTVEENILILWEVVKNVHKSDYEKRLTKLLKELGLTHLRKSKGIELSGGEKRRVEIARTLAMDPSFILLDEPFAGIDPIAVSEIQEIIGGLKEKNYGVLITDHNVRETLSITERAYIIHEGKFLLSGDSQTVANDPIAKKLYLGESFTLQ